jgi:hypothetical protein
LASFFVSISIIGVLFNDVECNKYNDDEDPDKETKAISFLHLLVGNEKKSLANDSGARPVNGNDKIYETGPNFEDLVLFMNIHGDTSRAVGASHQTGWTGVVAELITG